MLSILFWSAAGFLLGSLPFSVWVGRRLARRDPREVGDGNPGAANAWRGGGPRVGLLVLLLDVGKGVAPVALARSAAHIHGWEAVPVSLAPILGHIASPFLRFRGGKGIATTFGVWSALTLWEVPTVFGTSLALGLALIRASGWTVLAASLAVLAYLLASHSESAIVGSWGANLVLLTWAHRRDLRQRPVLRRRVAR